MTSNRCFCDIGLVRENLRRNIWAVILSALGFFFVLPLPVAMVVQRSLSEVGGTFTRLNALEEASAGVQNILGMDNFFVKLGVVIMALLCGVALFNYLHSRQKVDFYHSLPISRSKLFLTNYVSGVLMVVPAYVVMHAVAIGFAAALGAGAGIVIVEIGKAAAVNLGFFLCMYTIAVLCTVLTGNTIIDVLLGAWALFSPTIVVALLSSYQQTFYTTYYGTPESIAVRVSPLIQYFAINSDTAQQGYTFAGYWTGSAMRLVPLLLIYLALTAVLFAAAWLLFVRRRSERSGTALAFDPSKPLIKFYMVAVISLSAGMIFLVIVNSFWLWFGLIVGALIGHIVIEMIYHFDFKAGLAHWKSMIAATVILLAAVGMMKADVFHYDQWIPKQSAVRQASVEIYGYEAVNFDNSSENKDRLRRSATIGGNGVYHSWYAWNPKSQTELTTPENIDAVLRLAEIGVASLPEEDEARFNTISYRIQYRLGSGRIAYREYNIDRQEYKTEAVQLIDQIRFSEEYVRSRNPIYSYDLVNEETGRINVMQIRTNADLDGSVYRGIITDRQQLETVLESLREEMVTLTPEIARTQAPVLRIDLTTERRDSLLGRKTAGTVVSDSEVHEMTYIPVYGSFTKTLLLIKEYTGVVPTKLTPTDVKAVTIQKEVGYVVDDGTEEVIYKTLDEAMKASEEKFGYSGHYEVITDSVVATDPLDTAVLLENAVNSGMTNAADVAFESHLINHPEYNFYVEMGDGSETIVYYAKNAFPADIAKKYFG